MTRKNNWAKFAVAVMLCLPLAACKDTKTLQENEQLKTQVAELQKENTQAASDLAAMTAARDALTKENDSLKAQLASRKSKHSGRSLEAENIAGARSHHSSLNHSCAVLSGGFLFSRLKKGEMENENI